jgi:two-component system OmpR family response regulator
MTNELLRYADVVLDDGRHEVYRGGVPVRLTGTEFALLRYFLLNPRRVLSKSQILEQVWRRDFDGNPNVVETYVSYLRRKLALGGPPLIKTVRQAGYMLDGPDERKD